MAPFFMAANSLRTTRNAMWANGGPPGRRWESLVYRILFTLECVDTFTFANITIILTFYSITSTCEFQVNCSKENFLKCLFIHNITLCMWRSQSREVYINKNASFEKKINWHKKHVTFLLSTKLTFVKTVTIKVRQ